MRASIARPSSSSSMILKDWLLACSLHVSQSSQMDLKTYSGTAGETMAAKARAQRGTPARWELRDRLTSLTAGYGASKQELGGKSGNAVWIRKDCSRQALSR